MLCNKSSEVSKPQSFSQRDSRKKTENVFWVIPFLGLSVLLLQQLPKFLRSTFAVSPTTSSLLATGRKNLRWSCFFSKLNNDQNFAHFFCYYLSSNFA